MELRTRMDLALFDFDGTITTHDTLPAFMRRAVPRRRLWIGGTLVAPVVFGYRAGLVSGRVVRAVVTAVGFRGVPVCHVRRAGRRFAADYLPRVLRPEVLERIEWHRRRGDRIVVVSGGFDVYLEPWCRRHGLELLCSSLDARGRRLTGRYRGAQCVGPEKSRRVLALLRPSEYGALHAYGDTREDAEMLALAEHRWFRGRRLC